MYDMLNGQPPFVAENRKKTMDKVFAFIYNIYIWTIENLKMCKIMWCAVSKLIVLSITFLKIVIIIVLKKKTFVDICFLILLIFT